MRLLLSGATHPESEQRDIMKSTGGYISCTTVPNGGLNVLFDDVACYGQSKNIQDTIAIFLKNDTNATVSNVILQQIYDANLGKESELVKFDWSAVEPKDNNYIERIGNRNSLPYDAEWFNPTARREDATLKILTPGQAGDAIEVLGVSSILQGDKIEDVVEAIVFAFQDDEDYFAETKSDSEVYFRKKSLIFTSMPIEIITPGGATAEPVSFSGGIDEGVLLIEELLPGDSVGLWVRRTILKPTKKDCSIIEKHYDDAFGEEFSEEEMKDQYDNVECHEVLFSYD